MSENREDANWDSAQQTHREIQEEILHSRNLELFEDVEPLLPLGRFPACVEQEMPVDPWDPGDQKNKRKLPSASQKERNKEEKAKKKPRGHEIPDGAHEGFKSVSELLRQQGKGKGAGKKRMRSQTPVESDEAEEEEGEDDEAERRLLYGEVKSRPTSKVKKATARTVKPKKGNANSVTTGPAQLSKAKAKAKEKEEEEERVKREAREQLDRSALDFFNTQGPLRRRAPTPLATPPSSPPAEMTTSRFPPSPVSDRSETLNGHTRDPTSTKHGIGKLSPRTAAIAGFSQVDPIDFSWEEEDETAVDPALSKPAAVIAPTLPHSKSVDMMPPPPLPLHLSSPAINYSPGMAEATQFPVRRAGRRLPALLSSSERPPVASDMSDSPLISRPRRIRRRVDSSPIVQPRRRGGQRAPAAQVNELVCKTRALKSGPY